MRIHPRTPMRQEKAMMPGNPNSMPAANRRMMSAAAQRRFDTVPNDAPGDGVARDVKCVVNDVGGMTMGARTISVTDRAGRTFLLLLKQKDEAMAIRLRESILANESVEIIYEESRTPARWRMIEGTILTVC
jgi:hypothetical protein